MKCPEDTEAVAVLLQCAIWGTQKPIWSLDTNLKTLKNKAKLWLKVQNECDRPYCGIVSNL